MFETIIKALFFFLPSYIANGVPIILTKYKILEFLNVRVDFGYSWKDEDLFGSTKTWRGIVGGIFVAMLIVSLQAYVYKFSPQIYFFEYKFPEILILGFLLGLGEGFGDLIKSFIKRRLHVKSTAPFIPFDQLSFLGSLLLSFLVYIPEPKYILVIVIASLILPILANLISYFIGWKKVWW